MARVQSLVDQERLGGLLSNLAGRLDGAIDFWTLICLLSDQQMADREGFIRVNSARVRALVQEITDLLSEAGASDPSFGSLLNDFASGCDDHESAFLVLLRCRTISTEELREAVEQLKAARSIVLESIRATATMLAVEVPFWTKQNPWQRSHIDNILTNLFDTFRNNLDAAQSASTN